MESCRVRECLNINIFLYCALDQISHIYIYIYTHVLFYTLGVAVYSTPIAKMRRITDHFFSNSVIGGLLLNII
jgi:hypothetical protein